MSDSISSCECPDCHHRAPFLFGVIMDETPTILFFAFCEHCWLEGRNPHIQAKVHIPLLDAMEAVIWGLPVYGTR